MSNPRLLGSTSQSSGGFLLRPTMKYAVQGLHHALVAEGVKRTIEDVYEVSQKKQKSTMPPRNGFKKTVVKKSGGKKRATATSVVKDTLLKMSTSYHDTQSDSLLNVNGMTQNTIYTNNITAQVAIGTTNSARQGDEIYLIGLKVRLNYYTDANANGYQFRTLVVMSTEEFDFGAGFGAGLSETELFLPNTGDTLQTNAIINPKAVTVLHDETIDINSQVAAARDIGSTNFYVPLKKKFTYQSAGAVFGKKQNLYLVCIGSAFGATPDSTNIGVVYANTDLHFKNL